MARGYFVTGTDTGVGKTTVAVALIHALRRRGLKVAAMKPVAAGCVCSDGQLRNDDVVALSAAANVSVDSAMVNPYAFIPAIAPHIAAAQVGVDIELEKIMSAHTALSKVANVVVVEGVGGFRVPLSERLDTADLAQTLELPVILVVGMRLGCLNHALLTAEAIQNRGLELAGWVANDLAGDMPELAENLATLQRRLPMAYLGKMLHSALTPFASSACQMEWSESPACTQILGY